MSLWSDTFSCFLLLLYPSPKIENLSSPTKWIFRLKSRSVLLTIGISYVIISLAGIVISNITVIGLGNDVI